MKLMLCQNFFSFYDKVIAPELFTKNVKTERICKELLKDNVTLLEKSEITKKQQVFHRVENRRVYMFITNFN